MLRGRHPDWAAQGPILNPGDGCVPVCQELSSIGEKTSPFEREAQSAGRSRDQTNTRLLFQLLKRDRHRRGRNRHLAGGGRKAAGLSYSYVQAEGFQGVHFSQIPKGPIENSLIIDETNTTDIGFNNQEKPMSTSPTIADSRAPSANRPMIRVGLIGVGNWALNGPVRVLSLMPQYEMAAVYSQRRNAAQSISYP